MFKNFIFQNFMILHSWNSFLNLIRFKTFNNVYLVFELSSCVLLFSISLFIYFYLNSMVWVVFLFSFCFCSFLFFFIFFVASLELFFLYIHFFILQFFFPLASTFTFLDIKFHRFCCFSFLSFFISFHDASFVISRKQWNMKTTL